MTAKRLIHASPEGGVWSLMREAGEIVVLHEPAAASGGRPPARIGLAAFLDGDPGAPERRALVALVGTLLDAGAPPVTGAPPEAGAAAAEPSPGEEAAGS